MRSKLRSRRHVSWHGRASSRIVHIDHLERSVQIPGAGSMWLGDRHTDLSD